MKILLAEDDYMIADRISQHLQAEEHQVVGHAASLEEAKEWLANGRNPRPDICLLDIEMQGRLGNTDGIELGHHIAKQYQIPIIYLTNLMQDVVIQAAADTKPVMYCVKNNFPTLLSNLRLMEYMQPPAPQLEAVGAAYPYTPQSAITIPNGRGNYAVIRLANIAYIESEHGTGHINIYTYTDTRCYWHPHSLTGFLDTINQLYLGNPLLKVHASYVVNTQHIVRYTADHELVLPDIQEMQVHIPVSRQYHNTVLALLPPTII